MNVHGEKVFVGLSGGVDSAVTAALLQEAGARVTGVFIKGWYPPGLPCTWASERRDAMRVAARLRIPFTTLDASEEYKKGVIDYLLAEYRAGRTPNPDVMCNREVKFGAFYRYAMAHGADFIATGHYAQATHEATLTRGRDVAKDQSYFLWAVPKEVLLKTFFPLGNLQKEEVRALASRFDLPVANKPDSQGICFLGAVSVKDFLRTELGDNPAILHTLGERVPGGFVVGKDVEKGTIEIGRAPKRPQTLRFGDANHLADWSGPIAAQYRYHGPIISGRVRDASRPSFDEGREASLTFESSEPLPEMPAPGQSLVLYRDDECVGGGIIE
ncbi:MAG: tRNA 2-thiouridine(34) synthase MnmA [bacterium]|nr:tRNA 2-thiouridine(34) synthase MnmA [bacterium]